jgi:Cu(I)/Ag(I) efflux system membrane fusion protein
MKRIAIIILLIFSFNGSAWADSDKYTCPMHPNYISESEGTCPICGMTLVPLAGDEKEENSNIDSNNNNISGERKILYWQAPMNPSYKRDKPGKSPMGMDLVPIYGTENNSGRNTIKISPETIQNIGVRTEKAEEARFGTNIRSYGLVTENVRLLHDISSRVSGWVEKLEITAVGDIVKKGELIFSLYSPELVSAQQDYLSSLSSGVRSRIKSTKKRLQSLGVQDKAITRLKKSRKSFQNIPFYADIDGVISELNIREGTYVKPGMIIAKLQDYSTVWVNVSVAEKDLSFLYNGMLAEARFPNISKEILTARVDYIYPTIDKATRTGQVRLVLDNADGTLRPGAYSDITFETKAEKRLSVPSESILRSTDGNYVVVALGDGRFQPQKVKIGIHNRGRTEIVSGINIGDKIVVSSQFMIDSESSLRESFRKMQKMQKSLAEIEVSINQQAMINHLVDAAIYLQQSLIGKEAFNTSMLMPAIKLKDHLLPQFRGTKLEFILRDAEKAIIEVQDALTDSEIKKSLADLVNALKPWLMKGKPSYYESKNIKLYEDTNSGNFWIQLGDNPENPYSSGNTKLHSLSDNMEKMKMEEGMSMGDNNAGK